MCSLFVEVVLTATASRVHVVGCQPSFNVGPVAAARMTGCHALRSQATCNHLCESGRPVLQLGWTALAL